MIGRHRDVDLSPGRDDDHLLWDGGGQDKQGRPHHDRLPFTTRAISRSATRRFRSSRLSWAFFAFASAMATLATPSLKYTSSGTTVRPFCVVAPRILRISRLWRAFFAFASAMATLATPSLKYTSSGTTVR